MTDTISVGSALVGKNFNPSQNPDVEAIKTMYAAIIDMITDHGKRATNAQTAAIYNQATIEAITAQMWAVKAVTWVEPVPVEAPEQENDAG